MSWWERQWYKMLGGNVAIEGDLLVGGALEYLGSVRVPIFTYFV
jgi:hypothetical protein